MLIAGVEELKDEDDEPTGKYGTVFVKGKHLVLIAKKCVDLFHGRIKRLAISLPPRHGKSELVSKALPTWWIGHRHGTRVMLCSYGVELTREWSSYARDTLATYGEAVFGVDTNARAAASRWDVYRGQKKTGGSLRAVGKAGGITGRDVDLFIGDDVIKGHKDANNPKTRAKMWNWFTADVESRLEPWSAAIQMGTRWHHDDVIGRIRKRQAAGEEGERWEILNIPAVATEDDDELGRDKGEPLWPERFGVDYYRKKKIDAGVSWEPLYQGNPTPDEGGKFKKAWFNLYENLRGDLNLGGVIVPRESLRVFMTCDLAISKKEDADWTVLQVWGVDLERGWLILLEQFRQRIEGPDLVPQIQAMNREWRPLAIYIESNGFQRTVIQDARKDPTLPILELWADADKVTRSIPAQSLMKALRVWFPRHAPWFYEFRREFLEFPNGDHDDQVDALAYAVRIFLDLMFALEDETTETSGPTRIIPMG